ncbi:unnamed protein product [Mytilus coruscus]|uniref:Uncharacterized protein n=1 Tax=Mytilus coruscus TaxID=42192 RepID=A0A6J8DIX8_MYTCO|nr:unnamed protein product [Mytilus coruscus]
MMKFLHDDLDGINIMTDARHGWRKNAKDTTVVALGEKTHKESLDNIVEHYCNNHVNCHHSSRCKVDSNYEPSRIVITNGKVRKMLESAIKSSTIYKYPQDYILAKDTFYVESFNNVVNIFQDKRICFGDDQYKLRSNLVVCHWNENVDRGYTSVWKSRNPNAPATQKEENLQKTNL